MHTEIGTKPRRTRLPTIDLTGVKQRMRATWASGDYAVIGTTLQIVGETLCESLDLRPGERVLDVACGNGNATLAAARRWARVTAIDFVPELVHRARMRARAEGLGEVSVCLADAEALPFAGATFDVVLSTFGVMFTPNQYLAASELVRVCRPGGRIALANWTPEGFIGELLATVGRHMPPPPGLMSPVRWGRRDNLERFFGDQVRELAITRREFVFRYRSVAHFIEVFRTFYGPVHKAFERLGEEGQLALHEDIAKLLVRYDRGSEGALVVPSEYIEVIATRA